MDEHGHTMVRIEAGSFMMGSPLSEEGRGDNETEHRVEISRPFMMGSTEVSQALWEAVMGVNPSESGTTAGLGDKPYKGEEPCRDYMGVSLVGNHLPVMCVSWLDVARFCNALSVRDGYPTAYQITDEAVVWDRAEGGYRMPTEAEWEYAARAGTKDLFAGTNRSDELCQYANVTTDSSKKRFGSKGGVFPCEDGADALARVGSYAPNAWGLYDATGNVSEWTWDWMGEYRGPATDPIGPSTGRGRVFRGGPFAYRSPVRYRVAARDWTLPDSRTRIVGFRLARSISPED